MDELGAYRVLRVADADGRERRQAGDPRPASSRCSPPPSAGAGARTSGPTCRAPSRSPAARDGESHFLLEDVGPGTRRLCELRAGEQLWVLGPLGRGFHRAGATSRRAILVGGGVGIAPLAILQDTLAVGATGLRPAGAT